MKKLISIIITFSLALLSFATLSLVAVAPASAGETSKQVICHATGSVTNPYVKPPQGVAEESIVKGGHGQSGISAGDIIPSFEYNFGGNDYGTYPGQNWTEANQKLWANNCNPATNILTPVLPVPPIATCANPNPTLTLPAQPAGLNVTSAATDIGVFTISFELRKNTAHNIYAFPADFVNPVTIATVDNRPSDIYWDATKGACNMPDTGAGNIKSENILWAGILIFSGLVLTALVRRRTA